MSLLDTLKGYGSDLLTAAGDSVTGGATDWLNAEVSKWGASGGEVTARPETLNQETSPQPTSGPAKTGQEVAALGANLGQYGGYILMGLLAYVAIKAVK